MQCHRSALTDCLEGSRVYVIPKLLDMRARLAPAVHNLQQLFVAEAELIRAHCFESSDAALIPKRELCDLAFLPQMSVDAMFFDWHPEHLGC